MEAKFPGAVKVTVHTASSLFKQGTELPALQRGNLEMASPVTFEIEAQLPEYGVFGAAYLFRDADHLIKTFRSDIGKEYYDDIAGLWMAASRWVGWVSDAAGRPPLAQTCLTWCSADGTGQPASLQTRTIASLVSK